MNNYYTPQFYDFHSRGSYHSAKVIAPILINLLKPKSVVDVGCGIGTWLKAFSEEGINNMTGIDGKYVNKSQLLIPEEKILSFDLTKPIQLNRKYDLVLSLEVAEHIEEKYAHVMVSNLIALGDYIVFSAAVPYQRGTNHVNEQLPSYWKALFEKHNYVMYDILREKIWNNSNINIEYKQNIFLYVNGSIAVPFNKNTSLIDFVHPASLQQSTLLGEKWANSILAGSLGIRGSVMILVNAIKSYFKNKF